MSSYARRQVPLDIVIHTQGLAITGDNPVDCSLGGSETAVVSMARALRRLGHSLTVLCNTPEPRLVDGVCFLPECDTGAFTTGRDCDVFLSCRYHQVLDRPIPARLIGMWNHDMPDAEYLAQTTMAQSKASFSLFLSRFHLDEYGKHIRGLAEYAELTSNGVDFEVVDRIREAAPRKTPQRFLYASRPERGLVFLLEKVWPLVKQRYPEAELLVSTYDTSTIKVPDHVLHYYRHCEELVRHTPGVHGLGHLSRRRLWQEMVGCRAVLYPCSWPEISCMIALEAQALGVPIVTSDAFALSETVGFSETRIAEARGTPAYVDGFVDRVIRLVEDESFHSRAAEHGRSHVSRDSHSWDAIARAWTGLFHNKLEQRCTRHRAGVLRRLLHLSDLSAATRLVAITEDPGTAFDPQDLARLDELVASRRTEPKPTWPAPTPLAHHRKMHQLMLAMLGDAAAAGGTLSVLDVGSFTGRASLTFPREHATLAVTGLDSHPSVLALAAAKARELGRGEHFTTVHCGKLLEHSDSEHDLVLLDRVLEQAVDPVQLLRWAESLARIGVVGAVSYGPWSDDEGPAPLHHLGFLELNRMLSGKPGFMARFVPGDTTRRGETTGHWVFAFRVDRNAGFGELDLDTRIVRTVPLPKVSVTLLVKNEEANLRRCVQVLENLVEEIVIGDTGSEDRTIDIAGDLGFHRPDDAAKPATGARRVLVDIEFQDFAQARNALAAQATGDYLLWLDADEQLVKGEVLRRCIDSNMFYDGMAIEQRHASFDSPVSSDTPLRCFRPSTPEGPLRWVGCIHELVMLGVNTPPERAVVVPGVYLAHRGFLLEQLRFEKVSERNWQLLRKDRQENPQRYMGYIYGMRDLLSLARWELAEAGRMTRKAYRCLNQGYEIWHRHIRHFPARFRDPGLATSRAILAVLAHHGLPLRITGQVPFQADFSFAARRGILEVAGRDIPRKRELYASIEELREEILGNLDRLDEQLGQSSHGTLPPSTPQETERFSAYDIDPELFDLEPWED